MILIDSNIWAYYFNTTLEEHKRVIRPVETALKIGQDVTNATIVLETLHYLVTRLGHLAGGNKGRVFTTYGIPIYPLDINVLEITHQKLCEFTHLCIGGRDASILATMEIENIGHIMTHDEAFKKILEIKVIDPI